MTDRNTLQIAAARSQAAALAALLTDEGLRTRGQALVDELEPMVPMLVEAAERSAVFRTVVDQRLEALEMKSATWEDGVTDLVSDTVALTALWDAWGAVTNVADGIDRDVTVQS